MQLYTYTEARQHFAEVLDHALKDGEVRIRRRDGSMFAVTPLTAECSPLDVGYVETDLTTEEIVAAVRAGRERHG